MARPWIGWKRSAKNNIANENSAGRGGMAEFLLSNLPHWGRTRFGPESGLWGSTGLVMPKTEFMAGYLQFFWAGVVKHLQTGSVIPCQRFLVQRMIAPIPADYTGRVVELGSGTGGLTMRLAARCPKATILACEINPVLAEITRRNLLKAGVNGRVQVRAQSAQQLLPELMVSSAKKPGYIVSGLPIGNLRKRKVLELLHAVTHVLPEKWNHLKEMEPKLFRKRN